MPTGNVCPGEVWLSREHGWEYRRRQPEGTVLCEAVRDHLATPLEELIGRAADMAETWAREGLATAMNRFNRKA